MSSLTERGCPMQLSGGVADVFIDKYQLFHRLLPAIRLLVAREGRREERPVAILTKHRREETGRCGL